MRPAIRLRVAHLRGGAPLGTKRPYVRYIYIYIYVYVITPLGVLLLVYKPEARGRVAPINRNSTTKEV